MTIAPTRLTVFTALRGAGRSADCAPFGTAGAAVRWNAFAHRLLGAIFVALALAGRRKARAANAGVVAHIPDALLSRAVTVLPTGREAFGHLCPGASQAIRNLTTAPRAPRSMAIVAIVVATATIAASTIAVISVAVALPAGCVLLSTLLARGRALGSFAAAF